MTKIANNWWDKLKKVEHDWGETEIIRPYGDDYKVQFCKTCDAMRHLWEDSGEPGEPQFDSCRVLTDYPGDDSPCLCTRGRYLSAHGVK